MKFNLEKPIEDVIFENKDVIHNYGFIQFGTKAHRQYQLASGKKIDIVTWDTIGDECYVNIIEIKKDKISGQNGIVQAYEYAAELSDTLFWGNIINTIYLNVVLVGYEANDKDLLITKFLNFLPNIYTYEISPLDGIKFTAKSEGGIVLKRHDNVNKMLNTLLNLSGENEITY